MRRKTQYMNARRQRFRVALLDDGATKMTCREANCQQYERGWMTVIDETSDLGKRQAHYIRTQSGRRFVSFKAENPPSESAALIAGMKIAGGMTVFMFYAGQTCFREHADREVVFAHEKGESRRLHTRPQDWQEQFNEEAYKAVETARRG